MSEAMQSKMLRRYKQYNKMFLFIEHFGRRHYIVTVMDICRSSDGKHQMHRPNTTGTSLPINDLLRFYSQTIIFIARFSFSFQWRTFQCYFSLPFPGLSRQIAKIQTTQ